MEEKLKKWNTVFYCFLAIYGILLILNHSDCWFGCNTDLFLLYIILLTIIVTAIVNVIDSVKLK